MTIFETRTTWRGIPKAPLHQKICVFENLAAFKTEKEMGDYHARFCPSCSIYRKWKCPVCNGYHFLAKEVPGSGGSSGNQREVEEHLPRAEWEGKIEPQIPGQKLYVFEVGSGNHDGLAESLTKIVKTLHDDGAPIDLSDLESPCFQVAMSNIHHKRTPNGGMIFGWHKQGLALIE
jgi:hypothetical protein